ncbi:MAG: bZIP transcription factor [Opitutaceae bacterium]
MRTNMLMLGLAALFCAGCETAKPTALAPTAPPAPVVAPVSGTDLDQGNTEKVRVGETLKSYPVGRYVDPQDSNVMHESHVVYRKEAGADWNLNPNAPTVVSLGPVLALADPARTPGPLPAELEKKMAEQNQLVASLIEQNEALGKELSKLSREISDLRSNSSQATQPNKL